MGVCIHNEQEKVIRNRISCRSRAPKEERKETKNLISWVAHPSHKLLALDKSHRRDILLPAIDKIINNSKRDDPAEDNNSIIHLHRTRRNDSRGKRKNINRKQIAQRQHVHNTPIPPQRPATSAHAAGARAAGASETPRR